MPTTAHPDSPDPADVPVDPPEGLVRAQLMARTVAEAACDVATPGMTERELATWVETALRSAGATSLWTITNVGFGEGSLRCFPTVPPSDRQLWNIDVGHVDVHPVVDGWWGDCTRTLVVGEHPDYVEARDEIQAIHDAILEAATPGMPARQLWEVYRDALAGTDWRPLDRLGNIGHSIGRNASYTEGYIDRHNTTPMWGAWAVEPFIGNHLYGVKVEDVIWFGPDGCTVIR